MIINNKHTKITMLIIALLTSVCMLTTSLTTGTIAYGAEAPAGDENFNYNGYSATQLKNISECISSVIPAVQCPAYEASSKDYYNGTVNHDNMPAPGSIINTKIGWRKWADAAMKANSYDGVYGTLRIASGGAGAGSTSNEVSDVRFRLIGINKDNRADGKGKAGLTFQAIGSNTITGRMNNYFDSRGGWRDSMLRKNLNDKSTGTIWNAIQSTDFKNNITPVMKTTNYSSDTTSNASSNTVDKLFILSPSEMGMPSIKNYNYIGVTDNNPNNANAHYYNGSNYNNTIKLVSYDSDDSTWWSSEESYIYSGNTYQWWLLPAGNRTDGNNSEQQTYHNTDSYSYCAIYDGSNPSANNACTHNSFSYFLRSNMGNYWFASYTFYKNQYSHYSNYKYTFTYTYGRGLNYVGPSENCGVVVSFSF